MGTGMRRRIAHRTKPPGAQLARVPAAPRCRAGDRRSGQAGRSGCGTIGFCGAHALMLCPQLVPLDHAGSAVFLKAHVGVMAAPVGVRVLEEPARARLERHAVLAEQHLGAAASWARLAFELLARGSGGERRCRSGLSGFGLSWVGLMWLGLRWLGLRWRGLRWRGLHGGTGDGRRFTGHHRFLGLPSSVALAASNHQQRRVAIARVRLVAVLFGDGLHGLHEVIARRRLVAHLRLAGPDDDALLAEPAGVVLHLVRLDFADQAALSPGITRAHA